METSIALTGKGYVLLAADSESCHSIIKVKTDEDKIRVLSSQLLMAFSGDPGDKTVFADVIERSVKLYQMRHLYSLTPKAAASWIRRTIAERLRSQYPYDVNLLLGGFDPTTKSCSLFWMDYLGTLVEVPFAAHGYGSYFALSLLDRYHDPEATLEEGIAILKRCIEEVSKRLVISHGKYIVKVVDEEGTRTIEI